MVQLRLFEDMPNKSLSESVNIQKSKIRHGVTVNPTARGRYYCYWWNACARSIDGRERIVTRKKPIRGARVGTEEAEDLRMLVESWIGLGLLPREICNRLALLPRSRRRGRYRDWGSLN